MKINLKKLFKNVYCHNFTIHNETLIFYHENRIFHVNLSGKYINDMEIGLDNKITLHGHHNIIFIKDTANLYSYEMGSNIVTLFGFTADKIRISKLLYYTRKNILYFLKNRNEVELIRHPSVIVSFDVYDDLIIFVAKDGVYKYKDGLIQEFGFLKNMEFEDVIINKKQVFIYKTLHGRIVDLISVNDETARYIVLAGEIRFIALLDEFVLYAREDRIGIYRNDIFVYNLSYFPTYWCINEEEKCFYFISDHNLYRLQIDNS